MGLPFGRLADRAARRLVVVVGTVMGGLAAVAAGVSSTFAQMFGARVFAGTADAAIGPAAFSMLADLFPPAKRARAFSVYSLGIYIGAGLAFGAGGLIVGAVAANPVTVVPLFGEVRGWQAVFLAIAIPAFLVAPFLLLMPEPKRRAAVRSETPLPVRETGRYVWARRGCSCPISWASASSSWATSPPWLGRRSISSQLRHVAARRGRIDRPHHGRVRLAGRARGRLVLRTGWRRAGRRDGVLLTGMLAAAAITVFGVTFPLMPTADLAQLVLAPLFFFSAFASGAAPSAIGAVTPNEMRGRSAPSISSSSTCWASASARQCRRCSPTSSTPTRRASAGRWRPRPRWSACRRCCCSTPPRALRRRGGRGVQRAVGAVALRPAGPTPVTPARRRRCAPGSR
jgi:MFS family permease